MSRSHRKEKQAQSTLWRHSLCGPGFWVSASPDIIRRWDPDVRLPKARALSKAASKEGDKPPFPPPPRPGRETRQGVAGERGGCDGLHAPAHTRPIVFQRRKQRNSLRRNGRQCIPRRGRLPRGPGSGSKDPPPLQGGVP
ncbi:hypothetical protein SKAU_G00099080 [Synaphobranchus kaupii]|uniref:Uncharacterized protein n=1 Tax=Synaphobranchus kaupii TaxID=118154 RepID=A0A9Q1FZ32_SYNKA|nr:hypothetical protein SKAU_G00099080 [Synaphobranchus kaupii]